MRWLHRGLLVVLFVLLFVISAQLVHGILMIVFDVQCDSSSCWPGDAVPPITDSGTGE